MALDWIAAIAVLTRRPAGFTPLLPNAARRSIALLILAALASAILAAQPLWALVEVALGLGSLGLAWWVAQQRRAHGTAADALLLAALCFVCAGLVVRFTAAYAAAVFGGAGVLDAWLLVDGFSNPRFYGQFLTLALPLLAAPWLAAGRLARWRWGALGLLVLVWTAAITSGTRGTWLGLACAAALLLWLGPLARRWVALQLGAAAAGVALFGLLLKLIPAWLGLAVANDAAGRMTTSLSGREAIWHQAWEAALAHPMLGIGPMQLASLPNGVAAHPHQAWLQWAAELGLPSALGVTGLVLWAGVALLRQVRAASRAEVDVLRLCLAAAVTASLAQSMVDGVLVMPYSQLWLAVVAGWLLGLPRPGAAPVSSAAVSRWVVGAWLTAFGASVALLGFVALRDAPRLALRQQAFAQTLGGHLQPRFWTQGSIAPEVETALARLRGGGE